MLGRKGIIAIMGSGETTDSMVRVHRYLLERLTPPLKAVFIDTPAGFQTNADDLYDKAREYFERRLQQPLEPISFKSRGISAYEAERAFAALRRADYIFVGPGSPTYALKNWLGTPIPRILRERIVDGACFAAASAAALTLGRYTLPVYEIYKVGEDVRWAEGMDLLSAFGLPLAVIPHWNNTEGGTHDTRYCYMGKERLLRLEELLPPGVAILGIDEHTACIFDFKEEQVLIRGIGQVTLRSRREEKTFTEGEVLPLAGFKEYLTPAAAPGPFPEPPEAKPEGEGISSWQKSFEEHFAKRDGPGMVEALLGLEETACGGAGLGAEDTGARDALRAMIGRMGTLLGEAAPDLAALEAPLVHILLDLRERLRSRKQWEAADEIRDHLLASGFFIEDTPEGPRWGRKGKTNFHHRDTEEKS